MKKSMSEMQKAEAIGVDANLIRAYQEDGVVCLRDAISDEVLKLAHEGIEQNLRSPGQFFRDHTEPGSSHRYFVRVLDLASYAALCGTYPPPTAG